MSNKLNIILSASRILSVNSVYNSRLIYVNGKAKSTIYKTAEAKNVENYIKDQIKVLDVPNNYSWINEDTLFKMTIQVVFKSGYFRRDLDNTLKLVQDGIFGGLGLNDSHVVDIVASKKLFPDISEEKIFVCLEEVSKDGLRYDILQSPNIIWSNKLDDISLGNNLKKLPKRGKKSDILYYTEEKDRADTKLFIVEPDSVNLNTTMNIFSEMTDFILESRNFTYVAIIGKESDWGDKWKDICEFFEFIKTIHSDVYSGVDTRIMDNYSSTEIYDWLVSLKTS